MKRKKERRRWPREIFPRSEVGIVYPHSDEDELGSGPKDRGDTLLVDVLNWTESGLLFESHVPFKVGSLLGMLIRLPHKKVWIPFKARVVRVDKSPNKRDYYCLGVELHRERQPENLLMNSMTPKHIQAGQRLIREGDEQNTLYGTHQGPCLAKLDKEGIEDPTARLRLGDIVWGIAPFSGWPNTTNVDAETHVQFRSTGKAPCDALSEDCPNFQNLLTDLVSHRFSEANVTADRTVGKYVVNEMIARGGWSIVYKGMHVDLNMPVAIKMLKHDMAMDPDFSEKFRYEAKTIARLKHQNIVRVYDIEELYRTIFIVMEYLEGTSLDHILEKTPKLSPSRTLAILLQVCRALGYAHRQGIVHQDVKPGNIFVEANDRAKIVDFGLACPRGASDSNLPGTLYYMAPEQIEGEAADERTDIYCMGITAFEMITGQRPFPEDEITRVMDLHLHEDIPDPRTLVPDLPDELRSFIVRATQRNPAARHGSMLQAFLDLEPLAEKMGLLRFPKTVY